MFCSGKAPARQRQLARLRHLLRDSLRVPLLTETRTGEAQHQWILPRRRVVSHRQRDRHQLLLPEQCLPSGNLHRVLNITS